MSYVDPTFRACKRCRVRRPLEEFDLHSQTGNFRNVCRACVRERRRRTPALLIAAHRGQWRCGECAQTFPKARPDDPVLGYPLCAACRERYDRLTLAYRAVASTRAGRQILEPDCPEGHPYTFENLKVQIYLRRTPDGRRRALVPRRCRRCQREIAARRRTAAKVTAIRGQRPALAVAA